MRLVLTAAVAMASLFAGQAAAQQDHTAHHPPAATDKTAPTHEMCKAMMDKHMQGQAGHHGDAAKTGAHAGHGDKAMTDAEMKKMHEKCAAMMSEHKGHDRPK